jgi:hypothetical protein
MKRVEKMARRLGLKPAPITPLNQAVHDELLAQGWTYSSRDGRFDFYNHPTEATSWVKVGKAGIRMGSGTAPKGVQAKPLSV